MHHSLRPTILLASTFLSGCTGDAPPKTAVATLTVATDRLAETHDPGVVWDLLPPSYQANATEWCQLLATRLPATEYDRIFTVLRKLGTVLKLHADNLAVNIPLKKVIQMMVSAGEDDLAAAISAAGDVCLLLGQSELNTTKGLMAADLGSFLHNTGRKIGRSAIRVVRVTGQDPITTLRRAKIEELSSTPTTTELRLEMGASQATVSFTKVEGRWLPTDLIEGWKAMDQEIRQALEGFQPGGSAERVKFLDELIGELDSLAAIESRSKFERQLMKVFEKNKDRLPKLK